MAEYRRSIFLINRKFQFRFAVYFCLGLLALSFIYPVIIYNLFEFFFMRYQVDTAPGALVSKIQETQHQVIWFLIAFQITFLGLCFLVGLFISHRIAGPIYKLRQFFLKAKDGDLVSKLEFREKDYFQDLPVSYNEMMASIRMRHEKQADAISSALAHLDQKDVNAAIIALKGTET